MANTKSSGSSALKAFGVLKDNQYQLKKATGAVLYQEAAQIGSTPSRSFHKVGLDSTSEASEPGCFKQIEVKTQPERHARTFTKPSQASEDGYQSVDRDLDDVLYTSSALRGAFGRPSCFDGGPSSALPNRRRETQHSHTE